MVYSLHVHSRVSYPHIFDILLTSIKVTDAMGVHACVMCAWLLCAAGVQTLKLKPINVQLQNDFTEDFYLSPLKIKTGISHGLAIATH